MLEFFLKNHGWKCILMLSCFLFAMQPSFAEPIQHKTSPKKHSIQKIKKIHKKTASAKPSKAKHATHKSKPSAKKSKKASRKQKKKLAPANAIQRANLTSNTHLPVPPPMQQQNFVSSIEKRLVDFVHKTISTLHYSTYKMGGSKFDISRGIYILDCSRYVDRILKNVYPRAYSALANSTGSDQPTTQHFYNFFSKLADSPKKHWDKIDDVEQLQAGDILVFRYKNRFGNERGGHVMIVMDKPLRDENTFLVRVADSAAAGHSQDTRSKRTSGIGIGTILLKVDPETYQPYAYAWKVGSRWDSNVNFAMARPVDIPQDEA